MKSMRHALALAVALTGLACNEPPTAGPLSGFNPGRQVSLIECPTSQSQETTTSIGLLGGVVSVAGSSVSVGPGILTAPALLTLRVPASTFMEVEVQVNGLPTFRFGQAVTVTISYARCTGSDIDRAPISVWLLDPVTRQPSENMNGVDDKVARTVTFNTDHFSGYALAQ